MLCASVRHNTNVIYGLVSGSEIKTDSNDGIAGHARGENCNRMLRQRLRHHQLHQLLLHEERDSATVDRRPHESGLQFESDQRLDE